MHNKQPQDSERGLLELVMQGGKRLQSLATLAQIRQRMANTIASLSDDVRQLDNPKNFTVNISDDLQALRESIINS